MTVQGATSCIAMVVLCDELPPYMQVASEGSKSKKGTRVSLMERLVEPKSIEPDIEMPKYKFVCLDTQSRMNRTLLKLFEEDYGVSLDTRRDILPVTSAHCAHCKCLANF